MPKQIRSSSRKGRRGKKRFPARLDDRQIKKVHRLVARLHKTCWDTSLYKTKASKIARQYSWHGLHEYTLATLISWALYSLDWQKLPSLEKAQERPADYWLEAAGNSRRQLRRENRITRDDFDELAVEVIFIALALNFKAMALYGHSVFALLYKARDEKNDDALFKAVRIDSTVIYSTYPSLRIRDAMLSNDTVFLSKLGDALKGKTGKATRQYSPSRIMILLLHEHRQLKPMLRGKEGREFILRELGLYSADEGHWPSFNRFVSRTLSGELRQ